MADGKVYEDLSYDDVNTRRIKLVWKITDFSTSEEKITSAAFPFSAPENVGQWNLELLPNNVDSTTKLSYLLISLHQQTSRVSSAKVKISLVDDHGEERKKELLVYKKDTRCYTTLDRDFILNRANNILTKDELTIVCEIKIQVAPVAPSPAKCEPASCRLAQDLGMLLASKSLSDVTIAVAGIKLRAHKAVLAARSPVFAAMFSNQMLEKETSVVEITDVDAEIFQVMLEFIYTEKEMSQAGRTHNLLAAASKYQLERLKFMCEEALCKALTLGNVLENLALADLHSAPKLKEDCISLVMAHRAEIFRSPSWEMFKLSHQSLVLEILEKNCLQE